MSHKSNFPENHNFHYVPLSSKNFKPTLIMDTYKWSEIFLKNTAKNTPSLTIVLKWKARLRMYNADSVDYYLSNFKQEIL